jgi:hypothetical protein
MWKIKDTIERGEYKNKLEENLKGLTFEPRDSIDDKWDKISQGIHKVSSEVLGSIDIEHHNDWYDDE